MSPHLGKGKTIYKVRVPTRTGSVLRTTGTRDPARARRIEAMIRELGPRERRDWELLDAVRGRRLTLAQVYDAYRDEALDRVRGQLRDLDLAPHVDPWLACVTSSEDTRRRHRRSLARFRAFVEASAPGPWPASTLTAERVTRWLTKEGGAPATWRWHAAALSGFVGYLQGSGILAESLRWTLRLPKARVPLVEFYELEEVRRLVDAATEPFRSLFAFLYGTSADLTPALAVTARDVDPATRMVRVRGGKTAWRDRLCLVASWAWPLVAARVQDRLPSALLWPELTRYAASDEHRRLAKLLGLRPLPLRKARHHWAVRMLRAGAPIELVRQQMGHKDGTLVLRVYGRFLPRHEDMAKWEAVATSAATPVKKRARR